MIDTSGIPSQISVAQAIAIVQSQSKRLESEEVSLLKARNRVLAADLTSLVDHPSHDNSALDGYACRAADTQSASRDTPVTLKVIGDVPAGQHFEGIIGADEAVSIYTGAPMPTGTDAIIRVEDTEQSGDTIKLFAPAKPEDVRHAGEDFKTGAVLLNQGTRLSAAAIGVAATMGYAAVPVTRRARVGILATGDEVIEPGTPLSPGQVYNANSYSVASLLEANGAEAVILKAVKDDLHAVANAIAKVGQLDLLLTSGGVSMGNYDFVRDALFKSGTVHFWKVAQRPAGPVLFGAWGGLPVLGLPGNPVSSMIACLMLGLPFIYQAHGDTTPLPYHQRIKAKAATPLKGAGFKEVFARIKLTQADDASFSVTATGAQGSHVISSMLHADGLAIVPPHQHIDVGETVEVIPLMRYVV
jgi:molybdopterin molybdotransferase